MEQRAQGTGSELVRRTALANVLLTLTLAVVMAVWFGLDAMEPEAGWAFRFGSRVGGGDATSAGVLGDAGIVVAVDGISVWFVLLTALMALPAVGLSHGEELGRPAAMYAAVLLLESSLIGAFAAADVLLFLTCYGFSVFMAAVLLGVWGGHERRRALSAFVVPQAAGGLLVGIGLLTTVLGESWIQRLAAAGPAHDHLTFSIPQLLSAIPELTATDEVVWAYWQRTGPWAFFALLLGFGLRIPLVPLHVGYSAAERQAPATLLSLLSPASAGLGGYGLIRFVVPLFPDMVLGASGLLTAIALAGSVAAAFVSLSARDSRRSVTFAGLSQLGIAAAGIAALHPGAMAGGLLLVFNHALAGTLVALPVAANSRVRRVAALSLIGLPGLCGFAGLWLVLFGLFNARGFSEGHGLRLIAALVSVLISAAAVVRNVLCNEAAAPSSIAANGTKDPRMTWPLWPVAAAIVAIGVHPSWVTATMEPPLRAILGIDFEETDETTAMETLDRAFAKPQTPPPLAR